MRAAPVTVFGPALQRLAEDLTDTLLSVQALGLTASHLGIASRVVVLHLPGLGAPRVYVNPAIVEAGRETVRHPEASVSLPGVSEQIERPARVVVAYQDLAGSAHREVATDLLAVCHQHEIDQLDGIFWLERLSRLKRDRLLRRLRRSPA